MCVAPRLLDRTQMRRVLKWVWKHPVLTTLALVATFLVTVNGSIIVIGGGSPNPLSPRFMSEKLEALSRFAHHVPKHLWASCGEDRDPQLVAAARRHDVPVSLVRSMARAESHGGAHRISHAGAMGVMQLMPPTADDLAVEDAFDAEQNIDGGVRYIAWLWRRYDGDPRRVVAAYNAGPGVIPKSGSFAMPAETRHYVVKVLTDDVRRDLAAREM